jgi:hypothetical protein
MNINRVYKLSRHLCLRISKAETPYYYSTFEADVERQMANEPLKMRALLPIRKGHRSRFWT